MATKIVCLCGSTRFPAEFVEANLQETLAGNIVLSVGAFVNSAQQVHGRDVDVETYKKALDGLHIDKIKMSDEILVINVGGYVGESTMNEIEFARQQGLPIRWLEPDKALPV